MIELARAGYSVLGVDRSPEMIAIAERKITEAGLPAQLNVGDVRSLDLGRTFDAVISMFSVVGCQLTNGDLASTFRIARTRLHVRRAL